MRARPSRTNLSGHQVKKNMEVSKYIFGISRDALEKAESRLDFAQRRYTYFREQLNAKYYPFGHPRGTYLRGRLQYWHEEVTTRWNDWEEKRKIFDSVY